MIVAATPLVAGAIVTSFILKSFLARTPKPAKKYLLSRADQPVFIAFVDRLCQLLGAPKPSKIEMDLQANASARLNGWLSTFRSRLTSTLGVPLATGLTLPQFSGVHAHEFGHFSQHAGMRPYFLIQQIRRLFARVAFERDKWD